MKTNFSKEFKTFAGDHKVSSSVLNDYNKKIINPMAQMQCPTIIEERSGMGSMTTMDVFSRLMADRIIFLGSEIDADVSNIVTAQMLFLNSLDPDQDITLYLNTPGGSVYDGLAIYDTMQYISNDVQTACTGMAASMGSILLCAGTKGKRFALPHSRVLIHQPWGGARGQASDIEIEAKEILKLKEELYQIISKHSGQTIKKITADADRDFWMTAAEAKEYGMIDDIYTR